MLIIIWSLEFGSWNFFDIVSDFDIRYSNFALLR